MQTGHRTTIHVYDARQAFGQSAPLPQGLATMDQLHGTFAPDAFARAIISTTERLPNNRFGLRIAMALRRLVIAQLRDDRPFDVVRWGLRMRLHPRANGCEKMALFTPQMYEAPEFLALSKLIDDRRRAHRPFVFFDLGANVGLFSFFVASRTGPDGKIFAFEPEPQSARRFRFNLASNPGLPIRLSATAVGDGPDDLFLMIDHRDRGGTRAILARNEIKGRIIRARCQSLLDAIDLDNVKAIDAMKIDVEGHEPQILLPFFRDAPEHLWPRMLLIEDGSSAWNTDLTSELKRRGYELTTRTRLNMIMERHSALPAPAPTSARARVRARALAAAE